MLFVYLLAGIGLLALLGLAAAAVFGVQRVGDEESEDAFDMALAAVGRLQSAAWQAVQELRDLDGRQGKEEK
jgi:hypothetical protein